MARPNIEAADLLQEYSDLLSIAGADPFKARAYEKAARSIGETDPDVGIVLSTREAPAFRDAVMPLGVTHISAGSHTEPGGYTGPSAAEPQFAVADERSPAEVAVHLRAAGYDPVWKDWQRV